MFRTWWAAALALAAIAIGCGRDDGEREEPAERPAPEAETEELPEKVAEEDAAVPPDAALPADAAPRAAEPATERTPRRQEPRRRPPPAAEPADAAPAPERRTGPRPSSLEIQEALAREVRGHARRCFDRASQSADAALRGSLDLRMRVAGSGAVESLDLEVGRGNLESVAACARRSLQGAEFETYGRSMTLRLDLPLPGR